MKMTSEQCSSIAITALQKAIRKNVDRDYPDSTTEELFAHTTNELNKFRINNQAFQYDSMKNILGGHRWFFICPKCKERAIKLFLPPNPINSEKIYMCKKCHGVKNQSVVMGNSKMYQKVIKPLKRLRDIENKISKGYLPDKKVQALLEEHETIENTLKGSSEYKVYNFKKKHGLLG